MKKVLVVLLMSAMIISSLFAAGGKEDTTHDLILGTAGTSGTYYVVGAAMGDAINKNTDKINVIVQPTKGSIENLNLAHTNGIQLGMSNSDGPYWAQTGTGNYEKTGKLNIQSVMNLYQSEGHMVAMASSGIKTYKDLKGKKVNLGPSGQTVVEISKSILKAYGINPEKDITPFYLAVDEGLGKLKDGEIDATFWAASYPTAGLLNAASTSNVVLVDVDKAILDQVCVENPFYTAGIIPAGTYKGQNTDVNTVVMMTEIFASKDAPEEAIYEFVKWAIEAQPQYVDAHTSIQEITLANAAKVIGTVHPGALRYYQEKGVR